MDTVKTKHFFHDQKRLLSYMEMGLFMLLFIIITLVYIATFYPDQGWGDDFAQYIHQAINISRGIDMKETGYIYSRYTPELGPRAYPPGFPLLLTPVYAIFGLNISAFQILLILLQLVALVIIYLLYLREVSWPMALILLMMLGLSPYLISFKRAVMSDIPFLLVNSALVLWIERIYSEQRFNRWTILIASLLAFAGYLIRTLGFVILGALLLSDLIKRRRLTRFTWGTIAGTILLVVISRLVLGGGEESYLDQFAGYSPLIILRGVEHYLLNSMRGFWAGPSLSFIPYTPPILWILATPLIILGWIVRARRSTLFMELYFIFYLMIILAWPSIQELRFLYPILPFFLLYAGIGFETIRTVVKQQLGYRPAYTLAVLAAMVILAIYSVRTAKVVAAEGPVEDGPYTAVATALFDFIREQTNPESVFVFYKPRALALYTERRASVFPYSQSMSVAVDYLDEIKVNYVIVQDTDPNTPNTALAALIKTCPSSFELVFNNESFSVFQIQQAGLKLCQQTVANVQE